MFSPDSIPAKISSSIDLNLGFSVVEITVSNACILLKSDFLSSKN